MSPAQWLPCRQTRQTLLNFQPLDDKDSSQSDGSGSGKFTRPACTPQSAPSLPSEVWELILRPLGTIALKSLRLVCREWSSIGAAWLFQTVYLNCYEKSWAGLISLSRSSHATKVRSIEWNSLVLYNDCDDAVNWTLRYHNLLIGLTHRAKLRLYDAYSQVYRTHETQFRTTSLDAAAEALQTFSNCHHVLISDDYDLTSSCDDILRAAIANLADVLNTPSTWGLRSCCLLAEERTSVRIETNMLESFIDIFKVLSNCGNIKTMTLIMWETHLNSLADPDFWSRSQLNSVSPMQNRHLISLDCILKTSDRTWNGVWANRDVVLPPDREITFDHFKGFSCLKDLRVEVVLSHPGGLYTDAKNKTQLDFKGWDESSNANSDGSETASSNDYKEDTGYDDPLLDCRPDGFTESLFGCLCVPLLFTFSHLPNLRSLTLSNLSVNASSTLCFLCSQLQLPEASFSLRFEGTVVLYDLVPHDFFDCLRQLNVRICYDSRSTYYYYPTAPLEHNSLEGVPILSCSSRDWERGTVHKGRHQNIANRPHPVEDDITVPHQMPPCPSMTRQLATPKPFLFQDRPSHFGQSAAYYISIIFNKPATSQVYRIRGKDPQRIWEWVSETEAFNPRTGSPWKDTYILHALLIDRDYYDDYDGYGEYYEYGDYDGPVHDAMTFSSRLQRAARESHYKQDLLQQYERELLGTDVLELRDHALDVAVERLQLSEATAMPDLEEHMLHRYETELLGLDLITRKLRETR